MTEHQDYETSCQLVRDWLTVSRDQLNSCVNATGDQQHLEAAYSILMVTDSFLLVIVRDIEIA